MINKKDCCGCTACVHICPVKCIQMLEDEEGFLYPVINKDKCINCNKCEKVCPIENIECGNAETQTFVGYNTNEEIRKKSSSGGMFSAAAEWILRNNGVVFGAAFNDNFEVCHIAAQTEDELAKLRGSKYVQSKLENTYPQVLQCLENNRKVLFTGTACQIAGLKKYLNNDYENLYTIDVLCHGVPSPKIWKMYLDYQKKRHDAEIEKIDFRSKKNGWKNYSVNIHFADNQQYCADFYEDKFVRMFLDNIDLRPSCHNCRFNEVPRISDMTIGDSWGIDGYMPDMDDDKGTSVILVHSLKGRQMLKSVSKCLNIREACLDKALPRTAGGRMSAVMHPNRKKFFKSVSKGESFDGLFGYLQKNIVQRGMSCLRYILVRLNIKR